MFGRIASAQPDPLNKQATPNRSGLSVFVRATYQRSQLEKQPSGDLHLPRGVGLGRNRRALERSEVGVADRGVHRGEGRMVKRVKCVHSQLEANTLGNQEAFSSSESEGSRVGLPEIAKGRRVVCVPFGKVLVHAVLGS